MERPLTASDAERHALTRRAMAGLLAGAALGILSCGGGGGGGGGSSVTSFTPTYTPAAKGTPTGTAVTQSVDGTGGKVSSADGRLDVVIPTGALAAATPITIQPITNTAPNGLQDGDRLLPEGTTFARPVTLTFHLSDGQASGIGSTWIATQHADGLWYGLEAPWWSAPAGSAPVPVLAPKGVYDDTITGATGSGQVHLVRQ